MLNKYVEIILEKLDSNFKKLSFLILVISVISFIFFFIYLSDRSLELSYDNSVLSVLSLIVTTGLTAVYNLISKFKSFKPASDKDKLLKEFINDGINIATVLINLIYLAIVFLNKVPNFFQDNLESIMVVVISVISLSFIFLFYEVSSSMLEKQLNKSKNPYIRGLSKAYFNKDPHLDNLVYNFVKYLYEKSSKK